MHGGWLAIPRQMNKRVGFPFFQYSVAYGRRFLMQRHCVNIDAQKYWESGVISLQYLADYWKSLWALPCMRRAISFKWSLLHYALLVLGDRSLRMEREKDSADEQTRPRPKPDEEYLATESRMVQTR